MELNYDWRGFQTIFHPNRRTGTLKGSELAPPVYLIADDQQVLSACGGGAEDVSPWIGLPVAKVTSELPHREIVLFKRKEVDQWLSGALALPHFYDQIEYLRSQAVPEAVMAKGTLKRGSGLGRKHFLLEAIAGWWSKILPSAYGLFIRLEPGSGASSQSSESPKQIFVIVRRGRVDLFHSPDLSSLEGGRVPGLSADRSRQPAAVVKYLSEKHLVPVQGLFVSEEEWLDWSNPDHASEAWKKMVLSIHAKRARLAPFSWKIMALLASRAFLGI